jgi:hypothetical protein
VDVASFANDGDDVERIVEERTEAPLAATRDTHAADPFRSSWRFRGGLMACTPARATEHGT